MNFTQFLRILWARRRLVVGVTAAAFVLAIFAHLVLPASYVAVTSLVIDTKGVDPLTGSNAGAQTAAALVATQVDVINSRAVALQVVDDLKLMQTPGEEGRSRNSWASKLLNNLSVRPSSDSTVLRIKFEDSDPDVAAAVANAFAAAYLKKNLDLKLDPAKRQSEWFDEQLRTMRGDVESERSDLSDFQSKNGILAVDERLDVENARLEDLQRQLVGAQRDAQEVQARMRNANSSLAADTLAESPEAMNNGLVQSLKGDLTRAESRLAEMSARFGRNHPQYIAASAEVRELRDRIRGEIERTKGALGQSLQIAQQQVANLQRAFDEQKLDIMKLKRQRDELAVRNREVETAQGAYDQAMQRATQLRLQSQLDQTSIAVLDQAVAPGSPAGLGLLLTAILALVFGSMLGAALGLLLEMIDRRIRSGDDLLHLSGIEVLAEVPHLRASFKAGKPRLLHGRKPLLEAGPAS